MNRSPLVFSTCTVKFLLHLQRQGYSNETIDGYGKDLERFCIFMGEQKKNHDFQMDEITKADVLNFMDEGRRRGNKPSTVSRRLATLKSFYKYLYYECDYPHDIAARIKMPKVYTPLPTIPSEEEVRKLLQASKQLGANYHLIFSLLYYTGSRLTPIRILEKAHVHLDEKVIYLPKVKGGKDLYLPLHDQLKEIIISYYTEHLPANSHYIFPSSRYTNQPLSPSDIRSKLRKAAELANLHIPITPHTLRHCTATHLTLRNVPQITIASILGHADLRSTMRYQHLAVDHLRDSVNLL
ncbi:tyrosine-type recombinase/integrase [Sporosarcina cascadiensis]|uniref:tyrosine-type recombinase/integrase n=1 Tax=Sporosarcina cascadiensis TaxID=2660747 RepID=UPI00129A9A57|nr:tyrosine-type recombinase/integrase [Sporosarcina cascadiensis]